MRLAPLIRFSYMTPSKFEKVLANNDLRDRRVSKLVYDASFFKASNQYFLKGPFVWRIYDYLDFKVLKIESLCMSCVLETVAKLICHFFSNWSFAVSGILLVWPRVFPISRI